MPMATGLADDDDGMVETVTQDLVLVEGDEDERGSDDEERDAAEEDMFHDLFGGGAAQGEGAETFYKESTTDKLKKQVDAARAHVHVISVFTPSHAIMARNLVSDSCPHHRSDAQGSTPKPCESSKPGKCANSSGCPWR